MHIFGKYTVFPIENWENMKDYSILHGCNGNFTTQGNSTNLNDYIKTSTRQLKLTMHFLDIYQSQFSDYSTIKNIKQTFHMSNTFQHEQ